MPDALQSTYLWGKNVSGTIQRAGGVGGWLMVTDGGNVYLPADDAMGNVHAMIKSSDGSVAAAYDDAFSRTICESGPYAASNPFRCSTKYTDETGQQPRVREVTSEALLTIGEK